jgi:hypothetical protein
MNLPQVIDLYQPAAQRAFNWGNANLAEQSGMAGNFGSTGYGAQVADLAGNIGGQMLAQAGQTYNAALPASIAAQAGAQRALHGMPMDLQGLLGLYQQGEMFTRGMPLQAMQGASGLAGNAQIYQPSYQPSKMDNLMQAGTQLGSAYLQGKTPGK